MADKEQVEENGKGGDVVDGNSQGGKKGKKGETLEEIIQSSYYHNSRQGWQKEGRRWRGSSAAAAEPGPAGEAEAGHGDAQYAKPGQTNHLTLGI